MRIDWFLIVSTQDHAIKATRLTATKITTPSQPKVTTEIAKPATSMTDRRVA
jgi:hypothetical protein